MTEPRNNAPSPNNTIYSCSSNICIAQLFQKISESLHLQFSPDEMGAECRMKSGQFVIYLN